MKFYLLRFVLVIAVLTVISGFVSNAEKALRDKEYKLVWSDEFSKNGVPNEKNWNYESGFVRNEENQWYQKENAYCKDGFLIIEAREENRANPNFISKNHHDWKKQRDSIKVTSSCLITRGKYSWQYGRFEMRAKIPVKNGMWPAFWTLGIEGNWPANGEIDIMEYYTGKILANAAWKSNQRDVAWDSQTVKLSDFKDNSWADKFHIWRMDWDADWIRLYVDDQLLNEIDVKEAKYSDQKTLPFQQPHYLLVNLAVGGINGGELTENSFPSKYIIDYIRVYQKNN
ncbi:glycoside hydrolase family 16 protein [Flavobacterium sp. LHD-80]|uniref:glycoside hydrolase family 16 protein n=1 Tax=Flavobacterium sp. LHD-80 TaxID=3071411 RepID=UPI0027DF0D8D|nr:glycoside hydrolase family 16 protein [Flavobacterium sp. LHD-80]MDQ6471574.1 glycoside hydrolase family 16 protein [Flavobacterium sp. LHD-80]